LAVPSSDSAERFALADDAMPQSLAASMILSQQQQQQQHQQQQQAAPQMQTERQLPQLFLPDLPGFVNPLQLDLRSGPAPAAYTTNTNNAAAATTNSASTSSMSSGLLAPSTAATTATTTLDPYGTGTGMHTGGGGAFFGGGTSPFMELDSFMFSSIDPLAYPQQPTPGWTWGGGAGGGSSSDYFLAPSGGGPHVGEFGRMQTDLDDDDGSLLSQFDAGAGAGAGARARAADADTDMPVLAASTATTSSSKDKANVHVGDIEGQLLGPDLASFVQPWQQQVGPGFSSQLHRMTNLFGLPVSVPVPAPEAEAARK
jgi:hypothetical protein